MRADFCDLCTGTTYTYLVLKNKVTLFQ